MHRFLEDIHPNQILMTDGLLTRFQEETSLHFFEVKDFRILSPSDTSLGNRQSRILLTEIFLLDEWELFE